MLAHGYTYSGHPAACAVAIANIQLMQRERLVERVREDIAPYFLRGCRSSRRSHPIVGEVRGVGLLAALQLVKDKAKSHDLHDRGRRGDQVPRVCAEQQSDHARRRTVDGAESAAHHHARAGR